MKFKLIVDPLAKIDILESIDWYNNRKAGLGRKFYDCVKSTFDQIRVNPLHFAIRYKNCRMADVNRFPFMVHFTVEGKYVAVHGVLHTGRNPEIWDDRTK